MARFLTTSCVMLLIATLPTAEAPQVQRPRSSALVPTQFLRFFPVRDTIYVLSSWYVELDLQRQRLSVYERGQKRYEFPVSSGASWLPKGIETPTGLFTVQTKATRAISRQFENTPMLHWLGFAGNIGFHALEGQSYYRHLGHRPSSHGCVRLSREDAQLLYRLLPRGTPVLVYREAPARVLAFLPPEEFNPSHDWLLDSGSPSQEQLLRARLAALYRGQVHQSRRRRLVLSGSTILRPGGYDIGAARLIPPQEPPPVLEIFPTASPVRPASLAQRNFYIPT